MDYKCTFTDAKGARQEVRFSNCHFEKSYSKDNGNRIKLFEHMNDAASDSELDKLWNVLGTDCKDIILSIEERGCSFPLMAQQSITQIFMNTQFDIRPTTANIDDSTRFFFVKTLEMY